MLSSSNALFVFEAAARTGSFTRAAGELNITQPAVSRMLSRFEAHLGVKLFERSVKGAVLTPEGQGLYRRVADGFRIIQAGVREVEQRRGRAEPVTLSVSSAFTTHWLMPRIDRFQRRFPDVDLRFQLIAGSLRGPVQDVDLGMRFVEESEGVAPDSLLLKEIMLPVRSPAYRSAAAGDLKGGKSGVTVIELTDAPSDWASQYLAGEGIRSGREQTIHFSDYALVIQAALLGQGIALGWLTVVSNALLARTLVPASDRLTRTSRRCVLINPRHLPTRPVVREIRDWIVAQLRSDLEAIEGIYPDLGILAAGY
jgi:DNA-binding transcriptional LysR family regulator